MSQNWSPIPRLRSFLCVLCAFAVPSHTLMASNCGCDATATWDDAFAKANVIWLGTCMDVTPNPIKGGLNVIFQVDSSWKRAIEHIATVHTNSPNQCGYPFVAGERYIVFANKRHQTVMTSECEPNQLYADNGELTVRRLGIGFSPGRPDLESNMNLLLVALGLSGLLFLAFVVLRKKIMQPKPVS